MTVNISLFAGAGAQFWRPGLPLPADLFAHVAAGGLVEHVRDELRLSTDPVDDVVLAEVAEQEDVLAGGQRRRGLNRAEP